MSNNIFTKVEFRVVLVGLNGVGKTTLLHLLKLDEIIEPAPSTGFDVETIEVPSKGFMCTIWSLAGNPETRVLWKEFVVCAQAIIFVLDATDNLNFHIVKEELHTLAKNPHLQDSVFLILVNKIDQIDVFDINFIAHSISFDDIPQQKRIFGVSVRRREGIQEAMGWLADKITSKHQKQIFSWWNYFRFGSIIH